MTKVGIITDVHGNAPGLEKVLGELEDCNHIYCLGDLIAIGPHTNEVLDLLFSIDPSRISFVTGNHDEAVLALVEGKPHPKSHQHVRQHHQWVADQLHRNHADRLRRLPRQLKLTLAGKEILLTHYHLSKKRQMLPIHEDPFSRIQEPSAENMQTLFSDSKAAYICFGHHHPKHDFQVSGTHYINPGSLGCTKDAYAPFAVLEAGDKDVEVSFRKVLYPKQTVLADLEKLKVP